MKILNLSLDSSVFEPESPLAKRLVGYGNLVEKFTVLAPAGKAGRINLSDSAEVYGVGGCCKAGRLFLIYRLAKKILSAEKYDVISVQDAYYLSLAAWRLARKFRLGLEVQIHGWEKFDGLRKMAAGFSLRRADSIRVVSQRLKKQLIREFGVNENKITVAPIFNVSKIINHESGKKYPSGKIVFLTVGRLVPIKNINLQIEAMAEVIKKHPQAELWIVGDGPEKMNYESRIMNYGLNNNIKLLGKKSNEELYPIYKNVDVFVLSSDAEGWGLSIIEAAGYGLPIIMTDVGCAGEVIINDKSGLVIPVGDKNALAQAMTKLMEHPETRQQIGQNAKEAAAALPGKEEILALYKKSWEKSGNL